MKRTIVLAVVLSSVQWGLLHMITGLFNPWIALLLLGTNTAVLVWLRLSPRGNTNSAQLAAANDENQPVDQTLQIANETLPYLRRGLTEESAREIVEIIQKIAEVPAVAITDRERVLAYLGAGCERHQPGDLILTEATRQVIATGQIKVIHTSEQLNCIVKDCDCPLDSAVIVPLHNRDQVVGSLKLYQTHNGQLPAGVIRLAAGIAQLLSLQLELAELDRQTQLLTLAKLDALHAQINPHFFFNILNTIIMYSRTNPSRARRLLIKLAEFFRQTMKRHGHFVTLSEELECVHTYLVLEKARFDTKLTIIEEVDQGLLDYQIPVLCLQPLVENAIKHGLTPKVGNGAVKLSAHMEGKELKLKVVDDGVGITAEKLPLVLQHGYGSGNGVGLSNVHERLQSLYGSNYGLEIKSTESVGTTVTVRIPILEASQVEKGGIPNEA